ncbi:MAG: hypothetical protein KAI28_07395, partial [Sphingomonadales bacterium]|nr:hypothetical protein [Sphingomonadales bacterium]
MNEAFAAQIIANEMVFADDGLSEHFLGSKAMGAIDRGIMNVNGGAIAMGHPLGATGAMITGTMVDELERSGKETALITLCIGGGMGTATIIERV